MIWLFVFWSVAFKGIEAIPVEIQVRLVSGLPNFIIVGLPDKVVAESRERIKSAINSLGLALPLKKIIVNLSPADLVKEGSHYDLPIALAILAEMGIFSMSGRSLAMGELSLHGDITSVRGVLPAAHLSKIAGFSFICPWQNGSEAMLIDDITLLAANNIIQLINYVKYNQALPVVERSPAIVCSRTPSNEVYGHVMAKRAAEIAVAGRHNMLMIGPPGSGKSLMANNMASMLPPMTYEEAIEVSAIRSIAGEPNDFSLQRPFRAPHHSCSNIAMVGGGRRASPGEVSLAHNGILFLDELPEFSRATLESLRQPMEAREITIARAESHVTYPANFQLVAAMNPCRCGYAATDNASCGNYTQCIAKYINKISGPMLDRIDISVIVNSEDILSNAVVGHEDDGLLGRIISAQGMQNERLAKHNVRYNSETNWSITKIYAMPDDKFDIDIVKKLRDKKSLSARSITKLFQVARTIADLQGREKVDAAHLAEAIMLCGKRLGEQRAVPE